MANGKSSLGKKRKGQRVADRFISGWWGVIFSASNMSTTNFEPKWSIFQWSIVASRMGTSECWGDTAEGV